VDLCRAVQKANQLGWVEQLGQPCSWQKRPIAAMKIVAGGTEIIPGELTILSQQSQSSRSRSALRTLISLSECRNQDDGPDPSDIHVNFISCDFDGDIPPPGAVNIFLHAMRTRRGVVGLHCDGLRGRTGLFAAMHLMHAHGFDARTAMAWVRIACPGPAGRISSSHAQYLLHLGSAVLSRACGVDADAAFRRGAYRWWREYMDWVLAGGEERPPRTRPQSAMMRGGEEAGPRWRAPGVAGAPCCVCGGGRRRWPAAAAAAAPLTEAPRMVSAMG
jgi:hypothetical protein